MAAWLDDLARARVAALDAAGLRRRLRADCRGLIDVASNDYLGLRRHPALIERACDWTRRFGAGSGASRLITGTTEAQLAVEARLAAFKGTEAALVLGSGFQANATLLPMLLAEMGDALVYADRLNHASLHHGLAVAGVRQIRFRHNDLDHLDTLLRRDAGKPGWRLIVTESVFSMDGDRADLRGLHALAERHGAALYLDEAHATGVLGPNGAGLAAALPGHGALVMGTLGKALGGFGAYVAGSQALIDLVVTRCAGFIYATAPPPSVFGALDAALDLVPEMDEARARLLALGEAVRATLAGAGLDHGASTTQIVPVILRDPLAAQTYLEEAGFRAIAIRPPTVPAGSSRLRLSLSAALTDEEVDRLLTALPGLARHA